MIVTKVDAMIHRKLYWPKYSLRDGVVTVCTPCYVSTRWLLFEIVGQPISTRNILERRYELDEADASRQASYLLVGSMALYPAVRPNYNPLPHVKMIHLETVRLPRGSPQASTGYLTVVYAFSRVYYDVLCLAVGATTLDRNTASWHSFIFLWCWIFTL